MYPQRVFASKREYAHFHMTSRTVDYAYCMLREDERLQQQITPIHQDEEEGTISWMDALLLVGGDRAASTVCPSLMKIVRVLSLTLGSNEGLKAVIPKLLNTSGQEDFWAGHLTRILVQRAVSPLFDEWDKNPCELHLKADEKTGPFYPHYRAVFCYTYPYQKDLLDYAERYDLVLAEHYGEERIKEIRERILHEAVSEYWRTAVCYLIGDRQEK